MSGPIELTPEQARAILAAVPAEDVAIAVEALRRPHRWHGLRPHGQSKLSEAEVADAVDAMRRPGHEWDGEEDVR